MTKADRFQKNIKLDREHYPTLKYDDQWDRFTRGMYATALTHDTHMVLDPHYDPSNDPTCDPEDVEAFKRKKEFMYTVFLHVLKTDIGQSIVIDHEETQDGQAVFRDLKTHYELSTASHLSRDQLLNTIMTTTLDARALRSSYTSFVLRFTDLFRRYNNLCDPAERLAKPMMMNILQTAVKSVPELKALKTQNELEMTYGRPGFNYDTYKRVLLSTCANLDGTRNKRTNQLPRNLNQHEWEANIHDLFDHDQEEAFHDAQEEDAESGNDTLDINFTRFGPSMGKDKWNKVTTAGRKVWDQLTPEDKATILGKPAPNNSGPPKKKISANVTEQDGNEGEDAHSSDDISFGDLDDDDRSFLVMVTSQMRARRDKKKSPPKPVPKGDKKPPGHVDRLLSNMHEITYSVSKARSQTRGSLVDRGANGGVAGSDVRVMYYTDRKVDISGIDNHEVKDLKIATVGGVVQTQHGPVIAVFHQYAEMPGNHKTIHSSAQMEYFKNKVDDRSLAVGGTQTIVTNDNYVIPLDVINGLAYMKIRPYSDEEFKELNHVIMTSDMDWDPAILDKRLTDEDDWFDAVEDPGELPDGQTVDASGDLRNVEGEFTIECHKMETFQFYEEVFLQDVKNEEELFFFDAYEAETNESADVGIGTKPKLEVKPEVERKTREPNWPSLRRNFLMLPVQRIKDTYNATTQYAREVYNDGMHMKRTYKSPFPATNVQRRNEPVAMDTVAGPVAAIDCGHTNAQFFVGLKTRYKSAYGCHTDKAVVGIVQEELRKNGAMDKIISDNAQAQISKAFKNLLRHYCIDDGQSEPHQQNQNPSELEWQHVKRNTNSVMNRESVPLYAWLLCLLYVIYIMNRIAYDCLDGRTPYEALHGITPDISNITRFHFWEPVYYSIHDPSLEVTEATGRFVGFAENVGHSMTFKILDDKTQKVLYRSRVRTALDPSRVNERAETETAKFIMVDEDDGEPDVDFVKSRFADVSGEMPTFDPELQLGRTFLTEPAADGTQYRATIREIVETEEGDLSVDPRLQKFRCSVDDGRYEEIHTFHEIMHMLEGDLEPGEWRMKRVSNHFYDKKTRKEMVQVDWEDGSSTPEPLSVISKSNPVDCAVYGRKNNLLDKPGWRHLRRYAKNEKKIGRLLNQAKLHSYRTARRYKYGYEVARDYPDAIDIDRRTGTSRYRKATDLELGQLTDYNSFKPLAEGAEDPPGYKKIRCHLVYDIKHDGRHKARFVAGGHMTPVPLESVYSSVVSLRGVRLVTFLAELNELELWSTDIGNAYLEANTKEKVFFIAGPEFGELAGRKMIIVKALYGLKSSGLRFGEFLHDILRDMGFTPSRAERDVWMRRNGDTYEYVATYVDDLLLCSKDPKAIIEALEQKYKLKLKGTGPTTFHLGCNFSRDDDGTLCVEPRQYIDRMIDSYVEMFGTKPKQTYTSPLEKGDHPELDDTCELDIEGVKKYQSLIGALQWAISIGRFDISTAVMTMSTFRAAPRKGHLERLKRIYGFVSKFRHAKIRVRTAVPDWSDVPDPEYDWARSTYGECKEVIPDDVPEPLGKGVLTTSYVDANLYHDMFTGRSVTGILHFVNQTPIDWYSKKQGTVETATYGSEFVAAKTATEQIMDLRLTLRYLGVPILGKSYLFGDNESVIKSSTVPHSRLNKRHNALAYHRVREAIASNMMVFHHIGSEMNLADILSKHWGYQQIWGNLRQVLFWKWAPRSSDQTKGSEKVHLDPTPGTSVPPSEDDRTDASKTDPVSGPEQDPSATEQSDVSGNETNPPM